MNGGPKSSRVIIIVLIIAAAAAALYWYFASRSPQAPQTAAPQSFGEEIGGQIQNPGAALPETNPFEAVKTNPFEGVYKNPFAN